MVRKAFTTTIEEDISTEFKEKCRERNENMNDVLENMMQMYPLEIESESIIPKRNYMIQKKIKNEIVLYYVYQTYKNPFYKNNNVHVKMYKVQKGILIEAKICTIKFLIEDGLKSIKDNGLSDLSEYFELLDEYDKDNQTASNRYKFEKDYELIPLFDIEEGVNSIKQSLNINSSEHDQVIEDFVRMTIKK